MCLNFLGIGLKMIFIKNSNPSSYFDIRFPRLVFVACLLPLAALFFCEAWSVVMDFERSTATACRSRRRPWNFLPSISEATGSLSPQRYVWRTLIALHATPRFAIAAAYFKKHLELFPASGKTFYWKYLSLADFCLHITEIMCLLGLTFVSSTENYSIHEKCFYGFIICSHIHMIITILFFTRGRDLIGNSLNYTERRSLKLKKTVCLLSVILLFVAFFCFKRHEFYCEDYVYSMFALTEIVIVICNIVFHGTAMYDFNHCYLSLHTFTD